jgi:class 3 adenylate cyclase
MPDASDISDRHPHVRTFDDPDDALALDKLDARIVSLGGLAIGHNTHQPGWRWSENIRPIVKTEWCETHHVGIALSGRFRFRLSSGVEFEVGPHDVFDIPPGHDGWVVGDEPYESVEWTGVRSWIPERDLLSDRTVVTLVFLDIVSSTEMAARLGAVAWAEMMAIHEARIRDVLTRFRGREVKPTGDGVLATFESAQRAIHAARAMREVAGGLGLKVRIGVHTGEVEVTADDIRGIAIHEAARILSTARPSEILVSATTHLLTAESGFEFEDRGEHDLKGLAAPRRLYTLIGTS